MVRPPRARAQPAIPIHDQFRGLGFGRQPVVTGDGRHTARIHKLSVQALQFPQPPVAGQLHRHHEIARVAALRPCLVNAPVAPERFRQRLAFGDRHGARLFAIDILALLRGMDGKQRVPAVAGRDQHGVNVGPGEQLHVVRVHDAVAIAVMPVHGGLDDFAALFAHVADRHELHVLLREERLQVVGAAAADADSAHHDTVAGRHSPGPLSQHRTGHDHGGGGQGGRFQELSPRDGSFVQGHG
jgi:hypothetical protein